jgi:hypothetical protein
MLKGEKGRCEGSGNDDDLVLHEYHLSLSLEGFTFGGFMGSFSFSEVLISFKRDLSFEVSKLIWKRFEKVYVYGNSLIIISYGSLLGMFRFKV